MSDEKGLEQLIELQSQFAFQEDMLTTLNDIVARQQRQIDALQRELLIHSDKISSVMEHIADKKGGAAIEDERPPHY
ncbi:MAG: SlyX family protein [Pseudohongiellaceae bacterium]|nr:SlyX family protein [Pseudohongiellaceae bacterium]